MKKQKAKTNLQDCVFEPEKAITTTMIFREMQVLDKFIGLCKAQGLHGAMKPLDHGRTEVTVRGFKNKTARTAFTSMWASISVER
jgi:hypothetical protein